MNTGETVMNRNYFGWILYVLAFFIFVLNDMIQHDYTGALRNIGLAFFIAAVVYAFNRFIESITTKPTPPPNAPPYS